MFWKRPYQTLNLIKIDQEALINNVRLYQSKTKGLSVCPVLKANAYGHGLVNVAKHLDGMNLDFFIVDSLYEAFQLRDEKIKTPILILGYTKPENFKKKLPFQFTAFDLESLKLHAKLGHPIHIEVDTGMRRMGFEIEELEAAFELAKKLGANILGLFSHLATADEASTKYLKEQEKKFKEAVSIAHAAGVNPKWIHLGNSAGSIKTKIESLNMIRLGIGIYGVNPFESRDHSKLDGLELAAEVSSTIIAIRNLKKGDKVSYGASFEAKKDMTIAVIPFGYYEGLPRSLSNKGSVLVNDKTCPIIGRVCMNHTMIDVSGLNAHVGDTVLVYSRIQDHTTNFKNQSEKAGTIPYELMVRLSESVRRV